VGAPGLRSRGPRRAFGVRLRRGRSEHNVVFSEARGDPGIRDPDLTELGRAQAAAAASLLAECGRVRRLVVSPYTRTLATAAIVLDQIDCETVIDPAVREHCHFTCDVGTPADQLARDWPQFDFDGLTEIWWPQSLGETEDQVRGRCRDFVATAADAGYGDETLVVSHWGFIRQLTGLPVKNCALVAWSRARGLDGIGSDGRLIETATDLLETGRV